MRQRAMIAIALASGPKLLLADEPTTALDVTIQDQILKLLLLKEQMAMSVVIVTHDLGVIAGTCDRVAVLYAGRVMESGPSPRYSPARRTPTRWACCARCPVRRMPASGCKASPAPRQTRRRCPPAAASPRAVPSPWRPVGSTTSCCNPCARAAQRLHPRRRRDGRRMTALLRADDLERSFAVRRGMRQMFAGGPRPVVRAPRRGQHRSRARRDAGRGGGSPAAASLPWRAPWCG